MMIEVVKISLQTKIKIYDKHGVTIEEIETMLLDNRPYYARTKDGIYLAIGQWNRHLTIIFNYNQRHKEATIITAYPSSAWQIKLYSRKMK